MKIFNKIIFSFMVVTIIILTGCFSEDNGDEDEKANELEIGEIILIQNNVSGFVAYRYDYFTAVFDSKNIYKFHIIELGSGIKENIDNDLSNEQADTIFNKIKEATEIPYFGTYDKGYLVKIGKKSILSDVEYINLQASIEKAYFSALENHYVNSSHPTCMGSVYFTAKINNTYRTISCYMNTSGAPLELQELEVDLAGLCKLKFE